MNIEFTTTVKAQPIKGMFTDAQAIQEWLSEVRRAVAALEERMSTINKGNPTHIHLIWPDGQKEAIVKAVSKG